MMAAVGSLYGYFIYRGLALIYPAWAGYMSQIPQR